MRLALIFILIVSSFFTSYSQDSTITKAYAIRTSPIKMFQGTMPLSREFTLITEFEISKTNSLSIQGSFMGEQPKVDYAPIVDSLGVATTQFGGFGFQLVYKFYRDAFGSQFKGLYFAPQIRYAQSKISAFNVPSRVAKSQYYGMRLGYTFNVLTQFSIDLYASIGLQQNSSQYYFDFDPYDLYYYDFFNRSKVQLLGIDIGYNF